MPELPDVEVQRRYLESTSLHQPVAEVHVDHEKVLKGTTPQQLGAVLHGKSFESARRHGKHLFAVIEGGPVLHLHFGMTGFLKYQHGSKAATDHPRARFVFENGYTLTYDNQRLFGEVSVVVGIDQFVRDRDLGPDALAVDREIFVERIGSRRGMIKSTLMNQEVVAGIGNVYSDEILFQAGIHPETPTEDFGDDALGGPPLDGLAQRVAAGQPQQDARPALGRHRWEDGRGQ
jgi:formamidopyrimidine-DNA glycosylase